MSTETKPPLPPFNLASATQKVRLAEDSWNSRDPQRVSLVYTEDSQWRNRHEFPVGRAQIVEFLQRKWQREHEYRLIKEIWAHDSHRIAVRFAYEWKDETGLWFRSYGNENWAHDSHRIAVRFAYEWKDETGLWFRSYGNENWEFENNGLMCKRYASINDLAISESERLFHWPQGRRPDDHPGLSELGL
ncbi:DUF1348 family protein [Undibacterium sp. Di24W]|uniref:nuclear transport factor 2 family protein n=1 Tax=Undibacterium sp. Di24W TaxID=3413033 RepID=UPI003BEFE508